MLRSGRIGADDGETHGRIVGFGEDAVSGVVRDPPDFGHHVAHGIPVRGIDGEIDQFVGIVVQVVEFVVVEAVEDELPRPAPEDALGHQENTAVVVMPDAKWDSYSELEMKMVDWGYSELNNEDWGYIK
mgnify:CR=1 FL=1